MFAMVLFFSSVSIVAAQDSKEPVVLGGSNMQSSVQTNDTEAVTQAIFIGLNYVHPAYCTGAGGVFYLVAQEGSVWWTTDASVLIGLAPACQTGNYVVFHVVNSSGAWDQVFVLPYK
jgi:hypothetical protein